ncbi:MAG: response regulator, partial [Gemmatimonadetes bacterium]|nr:response regulator [Gemmatimonadota bacterium]NIR76848.1 response regulator [Gemmatimonadota bacterium]NIT85367.1 response regulator [Gemmatimonadota bacterium]NIU29188.1 response regulator [Gemmatimonadota bacterium]NIU34285.1 response regulator [Gemmatimonadota bacterium]
VYVARAVPSRPLVYASEGSRELLGRAPEELIGAKPLDLLHLAEEEERERIRREVERSLATGEPFEVRYRVRGPEGEVRWVWDRGRPTGPGESWVPGEGQAATRVIQGILADITHFKLLEERAVSSQRKEALGDLTGEVAHQFNNILTAILSPLEYALDELPADHILAEELVTARNAANRGAELNRHLLAFARRQPWSSEVVNLNAVLGEMEGLLRNVLGQGIRVMLVYDPQLSPVGVDPNHIKQVILNLALNARDAMPDGGKLVVQTANAELTPSDLRKDDVLPPGTYATLVMRDTGEGIPPEIKARVFEPFYTTREESSGLGLSTAFGIVQQAGGFIRIRSTPGEGTQATAYLPSIALARRADGDEDVGEEDDERNRILLVDDDDAVRRVAARVLQRAGYRVLEAGSGQEALRIAEERTDELELLVADVRMPGMGGAELAERVARVRPETRVLFVSGYVGTADLPDEGIVPGDAFLPKPFTPKELVAAAHRARAGRPWRERHPRPEGEVGEAPEGGEGAAGPESSVAG